MKRLFSRTRLVALLAITITLAACVGNHQSNEKELAKSGVQLTNQAIYGDYEYMAKRSGKVRWLDEGSNYSALETAPGYEDAKLEKDQYGYDIKIYEEIVQYDPATLERTVLLPLQQLIPQGSDKALPVDDYQWSEDKSKILIYTNAKYVWRRKDRGDYWVRDFESGELWQLGGEQVEPSQMMFGKFSPDGLQFAYVMQNNIYVQDLKTRKIQALTNDASNTIINGLFDWAYEEEFSIRDGFRWSPDSQNILYVTKKLSGVDYATSTNTAIYNYNLASKTTTNLTEENKGYDTNPAFSSKNQLAWLQMKRDGYEADKNDIVVIIDGKKVNLTENKSINIELGEASTKLKDFVVESEDESANLRKVEMSTVKLDPKSIATIPVLMGEADVVKTLQLTPGIQSAGDGNSGFFVRGGASDQNRLIWDGININDGKR